MNAQEIVKVSVVFRTYKEGDVIALILDPSNPRVPYVTCYQHIGQHGEAAYNHVMAATRKATAPEIGPLLSELRSLGYDVTLRQRR